MKKVFMICFAAALLNTACSESFLDVPPQSSSTEGNFFKTEAHFTQAVNNAYASLRELYNDKGWAMSEMRSDNTHYTRYEAGRGYPTTDKENIADFLVAIENTYVRDMWKSCYTSISKANTIIDRIETKDFPESFKQNILGQAKFVRAFVYFQLVQYYGEVPLQLHEVKNAENNELPRSSVEDVYAQITSDVEEAIKYLKPVSFPQDGSATQGAAKTLYAYVLMTKPDRNYAEAEKLLLEVSKMGYDLESEFANVFEPSKKNGKEHVFSIQYQQGDQGQQSEWLYIFLPRTANADAVTGVQGSNLVENSGWNVPTSETISLFVDGDKRRDVSIGIAVCNGDDMLTKIEDWFYVGDPQIENYDIAIPFINKYHHPHAKLRNMDDNWPVYRYSDVLLLLAECAVELGKPGEANQYLNRVRERAGLPKYTGVVTADVVANERRLELAFENHRWFDLIRTGKAVEVMKAYSEYIKKEDVALASNSYDIKPGYQLYPIPFQEMERNKNLTQNEAYLK